MKENKEQRESRERRKKTYLTISFLGLLWAIFAPLIFQNSENFDYPPAVPFLVVGLAIFVIFTILFLFSNTCPHCGAMMIRFAWFITPYRCGSCGKIIKKEKKPDSIPDPSFIKMDEDNKLLR